MWIAEWMVKPAGLVMNGVGSTGLPLDVDLDQRRGGHFLEHQIVRIEQEMMLGPRDPRRQMGEDEVVPAVMRDQPVGGGEVDPDRPFLVADLALERRDLDRFERLRVAHAAVDGVDAVHCGCLLPVGWAAANASSLLAFASARSSVG